jgi:hypothetical protein
MSKVAIAFIAAGLVVVPGVELANADSDIQLLQNSTEKNPNQKDGNCLKCGGCND